MEIPKWVKLSSSQLETIEAAIAKAESKTSGEIVPMIVRRSSRIGHVPILVICLAVILFLALDGYELQSQHVSPHWSLWIVDLLLIFGLSRFLSRFDFVQRCLTVNADEVAQVNIRAEVEFYEAGLNQTRDATGILLFVSLMEHRAVVLADKAIAEKLTSDTWQEVVALLVNGMKKQDIAEGFSLAIEKCGQILSEHFPIKTDDTNELRDHLVIKE